MSIMSNMCLTYYVYTLYSSSVAYKQIGPEVAVTTPARVSDPSSRKDFDMSLLLLFGLLVSGAALLVYLIFCVVMEALIVERVGK